MEGAAGQIGGVHGDRCHSTHGGMPEVEMAPFLMVLEKPGPLQSGHDISGTKGRQTAHAATAAFTWIMASTGSEGADSVGIDRPALSNASKKPTTHSWAI